MSHMPPVYAVSIALYLIFLALFLRYFLWKYYADSRYWRRRPQLSIEEVKNLAATAGTGLPFISILIPARNEAEVIANTIEHMAGLNYPADRFEILVITDAKEQRAFDQGEQFTPTTQSVVEDKQQEFLGRAGAPQLKHVSVPCDFDGYFHGMCVGKDVPSTKARALNYGLQFIDSRAAICGFYDAESHPEADTMLHVAHRWLLKKGQVKLWQGPVFQVRNFYQLSPITKLAALYQAISHEWYLPNLMRRLPFVGGTNFFAARELLEEIGGFDPTALTEDLEIGVRAALEAGAWPEYIPFCSTEQTPCNLWAFFRQRLRWASGHLQVVDKFRKANYYPSKQRRLMVARLFIKGQAEWTLYQSAVFLPFVLAPLILQQPPPDLTETPVVLALALRASTFIYFGFTFYLYFRFARYMDRPAGCYARVSRIIALSQLFFLPMASFFFPLPYSTAMVLKLLHRQPQAWIKTPRTVEYPLPQRVFKRSNDPC